MLVSMEVTSKRSSSRDSIEVVLHEPYLCGGWHTKLSAVRADYHRCGALRQCCTSVSPGGGNECASPSTDGSAPTKRCAGLRRITRLWLRCQVAGSFFFYEMRVVGLLSVLAGEG